MKKHLLDHLNDVDFDKELEYLYENMGEALNKVLDHWIEKGIIDNSGKEAALEDWSECKYDLLSNTLG